MSYQRIIVAFLFSMSTFAVTQDILAQSPGTTSDPLVSKSYIDYFLKFRSIAIPSNSKIKPKPGAMIIVRSGKILLEAPKGKSLIDLTSGKEIHGGRELPRNHLIIVPDIGSYTLNAHKVSLLLASNLHEEKAEESK